MIYSIGNRIYKYTLIRKIGGGSFGEVWLAEDESLKSQCALKLLSQNDTSIDERLIEAQIGNKLKHNNVVNIKYADIVQYGSPPSSIVMIAMPYFKNGSVLSQVNSCNFLPTNIGVKCLIDILRGLEYLQKVDITIVILNQIIYLLATITNTYYLIMESLVILLLIQLYVQGSAICHTHLQRR